MKALIRLRGCQSDLGLRCPLMPEDTFRKARSKLTFSYLSFWSRLITCKKSALSLSCLSIWSGLFHLLIWTCPSLQTEYLSGRKNRMANSVNSDEIAHYELYHMGLHCLRRYRFWSAEPKGLRALDFLSLYYKRGGGGAAFVSSCCFPAHQVPFIMSPFCNEIFFFRLKCKTGETSIAALMIKSLYTLRMA